MKVSVIVAVRNAQADLFRCVSSLVEQTLEDIEILLVDDASTDDSRAMMLDYESQFPEMIRCICLDERVYAGGARNVALAQAKGEYIAFVGSNDYVEPEMCEDLYFAAAGADICGADYWKEIAGVRKEVYTNYGPDTEMNEAKKEGFLSGCGYFGTRIYRRAFLEENNIRFPEGTYYEDNFFIFMTTLYAKSIVKTDSRYYHLCRDPENVPMANRFQRLNIPPMIMRACKESGLYEEYRDLVDYKYIAMQMGNIRTLCLRFALSPGAKYLPQIAKDIRRDCPKFSRSKYYKKAPWDYRVYLRLTMVHPVVARIARCFNFIIAGCNWVHDLVVRK